MIRCRLPLVILRPGLLLASGTFLSASLALAQVVTTPTPTGSGEDEVVRLSPFEVESTSSRGYATTSAMTASRIAVPITEISSSIIVINEKLIEDILPIDMRDSLNLISGVTHGNAGTGSQSQNVISMRGYTLTGAQRDGVYDGIVGTSGGFDFALFDRIEVVKGPSGILYGTHNPGGIVNLVSKKPLYEPKTKISAQYGSYASYRGEVDISNFFDSERKLGYRFSAAYSDTDGPVDFDAEPEGGFRAFNPSLSYTTDSGWKAWAWAAVVRDNTSSLLTRATHAFRTNAAGTTGKPMLEWVREGPGSNVIYSYTGSESDSYELGLSKSFSAGPVMIDMRLLARDFSNLNDASRVRGLPAPGLTDEFINASGGRVGGDSRTVDYSVAQSQVASIARSVIRYDENPTTLEGRVYAADFNFGFKTGPLTHNLLAYATQEDTSQLVVSNSYDINSQAKLVALGATIVNSVVRIPLWPQRPILVPRDYVLANRDLTFIRATVGTDGISRSFGAVERLSFWDNRAIIVGGIRRTELDIDTITTANNVPVVRNAVDEEDTTSIGLLLKAYKGERGEVSLFFNDNETFTPVYTTDTRRGATFGDRYPNRVAANQEYGIKLDLFESRVILTAALFETSETNFLVRLNDEDGSVTGIPGNGYLVPAGVRTTEGWDMDLNIAPFAGAELIFSYSDLDPVLESGRYADAVPFTTAAASARYEFSKGALNGFSAMWIFTHWGESSLGNRTYWIIDGGETHTAVLGYRWKNFDIRLRVENVFDDLSAYPSTFETAVGVTKDRNYRLALSYTF